MSEEMTDELFEKLKSTIEENIDDFHEDLVEETKDVTDHPEEDCDCPLIYYVRLDRKDGTLASYNYNASDMESEPYTNSRNYVIGASVCPAYVPDKDNLKSELLSELDSLWW